MINRTEIVRNVVIVEAKRTAIGRARKGSLVNVRPDDMLSWVLNRFVYYETKIDPMLVDDIIIGCAMTEGEQGLNVARAAQGLARVPMDGPPACTINRFCASALQAILQGAYAIACGGADVILAGGVESMTFIPMGGLNPQRAMNPRMFELTKNTPQAFTMPQTAQYVAETYDISREDQDMFSLKSHEKAVKARVEGKFKDEIIPIPLKKKGDRFEFVEVDDTTYEKMKKAMYGGGVVAGPRQIEGDLYSFDTDECPREGTSYEKIAMLQPIVANFNPNKPPMITAGNSCPTNDGAGVALLMAEEVAEKLGFEPVARIVSGGVGAVQPYEMGIGPSKAIPKALERSGWKIDDLEHIEINEAFAAVVLVNCKLLTEKGIPLNWKDPRLNPFGGAIALGHPLGMTGVKLTARVIQRMKRGEIKRGLVSMCIGGGMGQAATYEKI